MMLVNSPVIKKGIDFSISDLKNGPINADFSSSKFNGSNIGQIDFTGSKFINCNLIGCQIDFSFFLNCDFTGCIMDESYDTKEKFKLLVGEGHYNETTIWIDGTPITE